MILNITNNMTVYAHIKDLELTLTAAYNSTITVQTGLAQTKLNRVVIPTVKSKVNNQFKTPKSISAFL